MDGDDIWQRGNNLTATALVAVGGLSFLPELFTEDELPYKLDETVLALIAVGAIAWYLLGRNRWTRSWVPLALAAGALVMKGIGLALEIGDAADAGDDYGALFFFAFTTVTVGWLYLRSRHAARPGPG